MASDGNNHNINAFPLLNAEKGVSDAVRWLCIVAPMDETQLELVNACLADLKDVQDGNLLALRRAIEDG